MRKPFSTYCATHQHLLENVVAHPPPDGQFSAPMFALLKAYKDRGALATEAGLWNVSKHLLDVGAYTSGFSSFMRTLLDLEPVCLPPDGGFAEADRSIDRAPWRAGRESPLLTPCDLLGVPPVNAVTESPVPADAERWIVEFQSGQTALVRVYAEVDHDTITFVAVSTVRNFEGREETLKQVQAPRVLGESTATLVGQIADRLAKVVARGGFQGSNDRVVCLWREGRADVLPDTHGAFLELCAELGNPEPAGLKTILTHLKELLRAGHVARTAEPKTP